MSAASRDDMAVDRDGAPLPYTPEQVRAIVTDALESGEIQAVIIKKGDDLMVQVFGPPSRELLDVLETATRGYRRALKGH
jgi:hypothetical protein